MAIEQVDDTVGESTTGVDGDPDVRRPAQGDEVLGVLEQVRLQQL